MGSRRKVGVYFEHECLVDGHRYGKGTITTFEAPIAASLIDAGAAREVRTEAEHQFALMAARLRLRSSTRSISAPTAMPARAARTSEPKKFSPSRETRPNAM